MKKAARIILIMAILSVIYGYWGAFTPSGNKVYDEMDGMLPFFVLIFGVVLFIVFLVMILIVKRKSKAGKIERSVNNNETS
ncbi:MAG TPA: hypothetical protein VEY06_06785 [Flavisolibacter sp.]|jgi:heme/copper-type cytochrome/quinol oxidase subunit 2|nr:hypothetical protein [Flavisolibacter sp.]